MAVSATTGPSPACSVCTWVSVTLNGASTLTCGAVVSVDPVTATLPVVPGSDQSGVPPFCGAVVGHAPTGVGISVAEGPTISATEGVPADDVSASEPHAASVITNDAAQPTSATEEDTREFTVVTLEPRYVSPCWQPCDMVGESMSARHHRRRTSQNHWAVA